MNKRKSINNLVFVIESMGIGGAERVVSVLTDALCGKYIISIVTFRQKQTEYQINKKIKRYNIELSGGYKKFYEGKRKLVEKLTELNPDIVIAFDILPNILVNAIKPGRRKWSTVISERSAPREAEISMISRILRKIYYKKADSYVFQTEEAMKYYAAAIQGRSYIIPNPVKEGLPERIYGGQHRIVAVGRLEEQKNYICLLKAFNIFVQKYKDYTLEIYGEGNFRQNIEKMTEHLQLAGSVKLMGNCEDVHYRIREAQLFVMPSRYEGMPNALMEAMAMGFPVIASDCPAGGPRELIRDGENGFLFRNNDPEALLEKMCYAVECAELEQLGKRAREIRKKYSKEEISARWETVIEEAGNKC